ncbi:hypothetical protein PYCCODRAFT_1464243 [Trametes coccinea BRFM310]|uniref:Uncharacterized protein n=1 Tax=Trametes coccinea (strain BRFM310) TaxID=1353009 RepID=A0A1Y2J033_TRAC3|nr:hypothetical protein PYCCODRAFT_1464243 [Trametes coccinea BRFM310]
MPRDKSSRGISRHVRVAGPAHHPSAAARPGARNILKVIRERRLGLRDIEADQRKLEQEYQDLIRGLGSHTLSALADMRGETPPPAMEQDAQDFLNPSDQDEHDWEDVEEESTEEAIEMAIHDIMAAYGGVCYRRDGCSWRQRIETMEKNWSPLLPQLTNVFMTWRYPPSESVPVDIDPEYSFDIDIIAIYRLQTSVTITRGADKSAVIALARHGYLGNSPVNPSLAISFKTLELFSPEAHHS